jgi:hypothetical protein
MNALISCIDVVAFVAQRLQCAAHPKRCTVQPDPAPYAMCVGRANRGTKYGICDSAHLDHGELVVPDGIVQLWHGQLGLRYSSTKNSR